MQDSAASETTSAPAGSIVGTVRVWAAMVKFNHSIFALPFALIATFLAARNLPDGWPHAGQLALIVMCMVAARSVAMTFNRIVDADLDARNPRTANRPLVTGQISRLAAYIVLGVFVLTFGIGCLGFYVFYRNTWPILLSGPVLIYLCFYSLSKRFTRYSHFVLGSAIAFSPVAAWLAIDPGSLGWPAVFLMASVTFWIAGFDIIYACQDIGVDKRENLFSIPSRLGPARALWMARACHLLTVAGFVALGLFAGLGWLYAIGVVIAAALLIIENSLVRADDFSNVNLAFFTVNGIVSLVLATLTILDVIVHQG